MGEMQLIKKNIPDDVSKRCLGNDGCFFNNHSSICNLYINWNCLEKNMQAIVQLFDWRAS